MSEEMTRPKLLSASKKGPTQDSYFDSNTAKNPLLDFG